MYFSLLMLVSENWVICTEVKIKYPTIVFPFPFPYVPFNLRTRFVFICK